MWKKSVDLATNIKLGTRVRHVEDGVLGRIVWANASAVKILWDDGEKVTWKRAELGIKGLAVISQDEGSELQESEATTAETPTARETPEPAPAATEAAPVPEAAAEASPTASEETPAPEAAAESVTPTVPAAEPAAPEPPAETKPAKKARARKPKAETAAPQKTSALDAAANVLEEEKRPMNTKELIGLMAAKGYWSSPGGKTPAATLYSAILREMDTKGDAARFVKVGKGQFARRPQA
jgi:outer membrane biosynthesis protein TonB